MQGSILFSALVSIRVYFFEISYTAYCGLDRYTCMLYSFTIPYILYHFDGWQITLGERQRRTPFFLCITQPPSPPHRPTCRASRNNLSFCGFLRKTRARCMRTRVKTRYRVFKFSQIYGFGVTNPCPYRNEWNTYTRICTRTYVTKPKRNIWWTF